MKIIAYGSLMNQPSLEATLDRSVELMRIDLPGYCRIFNVPFDGYAFLNLQSDSDATIEAAYFELDQTELVKFAEREAESVLAEVAPGFFAFVWPQYSIQELAVLQSYLNLCEKGARAIGIDFGKSLTVPCVVVDDTSQPLYA